MAEIRTVTTLKSKRHQIEAAIAHYEKLLGQAQADLAHINAAIAIFEASGDSKTLQSYVDLHRLFKYGELTAMCKAALASGPKNTREIAAHIIKQKGLDTRDKVLAKAVGLRAIHALRQQRRNGAVTATGKQKAALVWKLHT